MACLGDGESGSRRNMAVKIFGRHVPGSVFVLAMLEIAILFGSVYAGLELRWAEVTQAKVDVFEFVGEMVSFVASMFIIMFALGLYQKDYFRDISTIFVRLVFSFLFGFFVLSVIFYIAPSLKIWRSVFAIAILIAIVGVMVVRVLFLRVADMSAFKRRILVLGAGARAARIEALERESKSGSFTCVGFVPVHDKEVRVEPARLLHSHTMLAEIAKARRAEEVVVAVGERRGRLPVESLLSCRLTGIAVTDYSSFLERETGKVDLDTMSPSWLIFSEGSMRGWAYRGLKRAFDVAASIILMIVTMPILLIVPILIRLDGSGPVFYRQERVGLNGRPFMLTKFRSMRTDAESNGPQWAQLNDTRVTRIGRIMRKTRIDEIPQIINVLNGDMSFIGPRPERPVFVQELAAKIPFFSERHRVKPGISGWAQLHYPYGASIEDAKEKFQYDLYYIKNYSIFLDLIVLIQTIRVVLWPHGVR